MSYLELDEFQSAIGYQIQEGRPHHFVVTEKPVWVRYNKHHATFNREPLNRMRQIADFLGCRVAIAPFAYVYVFWWGSIEEHPFTPYKHKDSELCAIQLPSGFTCNLPRGSHKDAIQ